DARAGGSSRARRLRSVNRSCRGGDLPRARAHHFPEDITMITNTESGTRVDEIAHGIYRISTPVPPQAIPGGFSFNRYLVVDDEPLLFHTGPRGMFALTSRRLRSSAAICSRKAGTIARR